MGLGYKNTISGKVKKNSKFCSIFFLGGTVGRNLGGKFFRRSIWAEFWPEIFCPGGPSAFFSKNRDFFNFVLLSQDDVRWLYTLNRIC
jgi:hypothetical protein